MIEYEAICVGVRLTDVDIAISKGMTVMLLFRCASHK